MRNYDILSMVFNNVNLKVFSKLNFAMSKDQDIDKNVLPHFLLFIMLRSIQNNEIC